MKNADDTVKMILKDLTGIHENLLSLSEYIWSSIDHNDTERLEEGFQFKKQFNALLDDFEKNKDNICALVSRFTGIKVNRQPVATEKEASENQRLIKELNKNVPHEITEDFTFKRPSAFIFSGYAYQEMNNWTELYTQFAVTAAKLNPSKLKEIAENPDFISRHNRKYYSHSEKDLRKPAKIMNDFYIETNLSANEIARRISEIISHLGMKTSDITIYLRQDRNA